MRQDEQPDDEEMIGVVRQHVAAANVLRGDALGSVRAIKRQALREQKEANLRIVQTEKQLRRATGLERNGLLKNHKRFLQQRARADQVYALAIEDEKRLRS